MNPITKEFLSIYILFSAISIILFYAFIHEAIALARYKRKLSLNKPIIGFLVFVIIIPSLFFLANLDWNWNIIKPTPLWYTSWGNFPVEPSREETNAYNIRILCQSISFIILSTLNAPVLFGSLAIAFTYKDSLQLNLEDKKNA